MQVFRAIFFFFPRAWLVCALLAGLAGLGWAGSAGAQAARDLAEKRAQAARAIQAREGAITRLGAQLAELEEARAALEADLGAGRQARRAMLRSLIRLALSPEPGRSKPEEALDRLRGGLVLRRLRATATVQLRALAAQAALAARLRADSAAAQKKLFAEHGALARLHKVLDEMLAARPAAPDARAQRRRQEALVRGAQDLTGLAAALDRLAGGAGRGGGGLRLRRPVEGFLVASFGQTPTPDAAPGQGVRLSALNDGQVVAPAAGRVVFAGPFRAYGGVLILEAPGGYHILLTGLGRLTARLGESVEAGAPVGRMRKRRRAAREELYLEVRKDGRPVNPLLLIDSDWSLSLPFFLEF